MRHVVRVTLHAAAWRFFQWLGADPVPYTPPAGNAANLNFTQAYTVPAGNAAAVHFGS